MIVKMFDKIIFACAFIIALQCPQLSDHQSPSSNAEPSVRADAKQKQQTLLQFADLTKGMAIFEQGNLLQKILYMFSVERFDRLHNTFDNFKLGIPLTTRRRCLR